jgi:6-phosphogluconolactonase
VNIGPKPEIRIFDTLEALSLAAAEIVASSAQRVISSTGRFAVALSGGSTPRRMYTLLASSPWRERIVWNGAHFFWTDERCVPWDHRESNFKLAHDAFLAKVGAPTGNIHRISGEEEPECAAHDYEDGLRSFFGSSSIPAFDLVILGVGQDGHTASLFPGAAAVRERTRLAVPVHFDLPKHSRVTLTLPVLTNAAQVVFLVSGREKAGIVHEILEDGNPRLCPAGLVRPVHGRVTWMLGRDAAGLIENGGWMQNKADSRI